MHFNQLFIETKHMKYTKKMKGNKEVAMALMEQLLQPHNPVNALRFFT